MQAKDRYERHAMKGLGLVGFLKTPGPSWSVGVFGIFHK